LLFGEIDPGDYNYNDVVVLYEVAFSVRFRLEGYLEAFELFKSKIIDIM